MRSTIPRSVHSEIGLSGLESGIPSMLAKRFDERFEPVSLRSTPGFEVRIMFSTLSDRSELVLGSAAGDLTLPPVC